MIAIELGVGEWDLAIDDMVRGAVHGACPVPGHVIARLHEWLDGYDSTAARSTARLCEQTALRLTPAKWRRIWRAGRRELRQRPRRLRRPGRSLREWFRPPWIPQTEGLQ